MRAVSNADNNCTRTVVRKRLNKRIVPGMALRLFRRVVDVNCGRMEAFSAVCPADIGVAMPDEARRPGAAPRRTLRPTWR